MTNLAEFPTPHTTAGELWSLSQIPHTAVDVAGWIWLGCPARRGGGPQVSPIPIPRLWSVVVNFWRELRSSLSHHIWGFHGFHNG